MNITSILVKLNSMNTNTSTSITHILVKLNNTNKTTSMSIAHILVRLNSMNDDIESWGVYLSPAEGDDVTGGGDAVVDGGTKSSMSGGGRAWSS
jgi:hypothetical protein